MSQGGARGSLAIDMRVSGRDLPKLPGRCCGIFVSLLACALMATAAFFPSPPGASQVSATWNLDIGTVSFTADVGPQQGCLTISGAVSVLGVSDSCEVSFCGDSQEALNTYGDGLKSLQTGAVLGAVAVLLSLPLGYLVKTIKQDCGEEGNITARQSSHMPKDYTLFIPGTLALVGAAAMLYGVVQWNSMMSNLIQDTGHNQCQFYSTVAGSNPSLSNSCGLGLDDTQGSLAAAGVLPALAEQAVGSSSIGSNILMDICIGVVDVVDVFQPKQKLTSVFLGVAVAGAVFALAAAALFCRADYVRYRVRSQLLKLAAQEPFLAAGTAPAASPSKHAQPGYSRL